MANIRVHALRKAFKGHEALKSVSLEVRDQEFCVLLGPSGCGKTTLLRIIAGLEETTSGDVYIGDQRVNDLAPRERKLAMVFQNYAVFPHMTVRENIGFGLKMQKTASADLAREVERAATLMHIESLLDRYSGQLSGGQRQRVAVARALATRPSVLLMDEPLSNLDALLRLEMRAELKHLLQSTQTTTIYVTHDQVEAMSLADRIAVMNGGVIEQYDAPMQVYQSPATRFVGSFIGNPPMNFIDTARVSQWLTTDVHKDATQFGIRPEEFSLGESGWPFQLRVIEALGSHIQLTGDVAGQNIRVNVPVGTSLSAGETLHLVPQVGKLRPFDAQGRAL